MKKTFRDMLVRNRWLKWIPNALTLCNSLCGFAAILYSLGVYESGLGGRERAALEVFAISAVIIMGAMIFDALDGFAARLLNAASMHGLQMDSLSDMVTFGVAPATVVAIMTHWLRTSRLEQPASLWLNTVIYCLCAIYVGCAALRLATYNVHALLEKKSSDKFTGLPSPGAAAGICSLVIIWQTFDARLSPLAMWLPIYAALMGLLMVSPVPYPHAAKWLVSVKRNPRRLVMLLVLLGVVAVFRLAGLVTLINLYILGCPVYYWYNLIRRRFSGRKGEQCTI